jgi:hypothetical protein
MMQRRARSGGFAAAAVVAGGVVASCMSQSDSSLARFGTPSAGGDRSRSAAAAGARRGLQNGDYSCSIESAGYQYPAFRCAVYGAEDGGQMLEKLGGSQRFRGRVTLGERGFSFDGTFYCPYGDCTESVTAQFQSIGGSTYRGAMQGRSGPLSVSLQYLPGGFTYGGANSAGHMDTVPPVPPAPAPSTGAEPAPAPDRQEVPEQFLQPLHLPEPAVTWPAVSR